MDAAVKAQWVEALRSGDYRQGKGCLHFRPHDDLLPPADDTFCCLGVLCDLAIKAGVEVKAWRGPGVQQYDGEASFLPSAVVAWSGLPDPAGDVRDPRVQDLHGDWTSLSAVNDAGAPFAEIAAMIEAQL